MATGRTIDARLNIVANLDTSQIKSGINSIQGQLSKLNLPKGMEANFTKVFDKLKNDLTQIEALRAKGLKTKADYNSYNKLTDSINASYSRIINLIDQIDSKKITPKVDTERIKQLKTELKEAEAAYKNMWKSSSAYTGDNGIKNLKSTLEGLSTSSKKLKPNLDAMMTSLKSGDIDGARAAADRLFGTLTKLGAKNKIKIAESLGLNDLAEKMNQATANGGKLGAELNKSFKSQALEKLLSLLGTLEVDFNGADARVKALNADLSQEKSSQIERADKAVKQLSNDARAAADSTKQLTQNSQQNVMYQYDKTMQVNDLRMQVQYFFGLQNMIRLFQRGVKDAVATVKELDAAMTQTAVVTNYSVSDMWEKLPEYTKNANKLSTTIADMYNATTLYYQQGLNDQQAMGTAVETLKMARIAAIDGAEATDLMTAALRGFRLESNEVNASHVNDVYSILAARTASDTYEIGTAVSKTASLASSANMDLESTATFLAQIIETTREAPETAGTALKTIIARFGEVKKLIDEGKSIGSDEEGEVIDVNKVDAALKTAGISLQEFIKGNEGLDKVFLRLAERWDTLSVSQQRYIATQAAGARQQSRFIAMLQDYGRTQQLLDYAYNAEGAGDEQFAKTKQSLEAKINELKNSYHTFIMGIANSSAIKTVIDAMSTGFNAINKIIKSINTGVSELNKHLGAAVTAALSLGTAFAALKIGGKALNLGVNAIGTMMLGRGAMAQGKAQGTAGGLMGGVQNARATAFTRPITSRLDTLIAITKIGNKNAANLAAKATENGTPLSLAGKEFRTARGEINTAFSGGKLSAKDLSKTMSQYDDATQRALMASSPGIASALKRGYFGGVKELGKSGQLDKVGQIAAQSFITSQEKAFKTGKIDFASYNKSALMASDKYLSSHIQAASKAYNHPVFDMYNDMQKAEAIQKQAIKRRAAEKFQENLAKKGITYDKRQKSWIDSAGGAYSKERLNEMYQGTLRGIKGQAGSLGSNPMDPTKAELLANKFGAVGGAISSAGMSLQFFSVQLSSMGADKAAAAVSGLGSALTSVGMAANSVGSIITMVDKIPKSASIAGLAITGVVATIVMAYKSYQNYIKKIRDEGKKVTEDYQNNAVKQKKNLSELNSSYEEYQRLRNGVDAKGNNVSLDENEYKRYQELTNKLIKMNGALKQGVNESGQAYISQSADIRKALEDETKDIQRAQELYLTNGSGQSLIDQAATYKRVQKAFNTKDVLKGQRIEATNMVYGDGTAAAPAGGSRVGGATYTSGAYAGGKLTQEANSIKAAVDSLENSEQIYNDLDFNGINWKDIDAYDAKKIYDQSSALAAYIDSSKELTDEQKANATKAVTELTKTYDSAIEAVKPTTDWLETYLSSTGMDASSIEKMMIDKFNFKNLSNVDADAHLADFGKQQASSLVGGFRSGLEELTLQGQYEGWNAEELKAHAEEYSQSLKDLSSSTTSEGQKYTGALQGIAEAQAKFDESLDAGTSLEDASQAYTDSITDEIQALDSLARQYEEAAAKGDIGAGLIAESIRDGMYQAVAYTTESEAQITESLNSLSRSFETAHSALSKYQEQTKDLNDYYTAAEGMKQILSDIGWDEEKGKFTGQDAQGHGSQKFWLAAENLVDEATMDQGIDAVKKKMSELVPTLEEGKDGFDNFIRLLHKNKDALKDFYKEKEDGTFDIDVDDTNLHEMAETLGVADEYLASMIDKSRQFMKWDLSEPKQLAAAIKKSEQTLQSGKGDNAQYYYNYSDLRATALSQGITDFGPGSEFDNTIKELQSKGIKVLNVDDLTKTASKNAKPEEKKQIAENKKIQTQYVKDLVKGYGFNKETSYEEMVKPFIESGQYTSEDTYEILKASGVLKDRGETKDQQIEKITKAFEEGSQDPELEVSNKIADNTQRTNELLAQMVADSGQIPKGVAESVDNSYKEVFGKKGVDTYFQKFGQGTNTQDKQLTYEEKKEGVTKAETKLNELETNKQLLERVLKANPADDEAQKKLDKVNTTIDKLTKYKEAGGAGITTAETLLGGNAENFNFNNFTKDDFSGLRNLDEALKNIDPKKVSEVTRAIQESGLSKDRQQDVLGQYYKQRLLDSGEITGKADKKYLGRQDADQKLGQVLNSKDLEEFKANIHAASISFQTYPQLAQQLRDSFAEIKGLNPFKDEDYWELNKNLGIGTTEETPYLKKQLASEEGRQEIVEFIGKDESVKSTIEGIENEADRIKVIDAMLQIKEGENTEEAKQTLEEILGKDGATAVVKYVAHTNDVDQTAKKIEKNPVEKKVKYTTDTKEPDQKKQDIEGTPLIQKIKQQIIPTGGKVQEGVDEVTKNAGKTKAQIPVTADNSSANSKIDESINKAKNAKPKMEIGAKLGSSFTSALSDAKSQVNDSKAYLKIYAKKAGKWPAGAGDFWTGRNNHRMGAYSTGYKTIPLSSYASGKKRTTRGNTIPALTGELGPEMAWYPKEGRAELLGVGGPQYVPDLPKDSVIWNAKQTKEILDRKSIPLKSHATGTGNLPSDINGSGRGSNKIKTKTKTKTSSNKDSKKTANKVASIDQKIGTISKRDIKIYNLTKQIEQTSNKIEKNSDAIKKKLSDTIDFHYSQIRKQVGEQTKLLQKSESQNKSLSSQYSKQLKNLDQGKGKYKNYKITYEKTSKGKKGKKETKNANKKINLGRFIKRDKKTGAYVIDEKAIQKVAKNKKQGKKMAQAIFDAAQKEIDDLTSKKTSADKAAIDAKQKLEDLRKELQDTLFAWENELTKIKDLETKIQLSDSFLDMLDSMQKLITNMANGSLSNLANLSKQYQTSIQAGIAATINKIKQQESLLVAYKDELKDDLSLKDEYAALADARKKLASAKSTGEKEKYKALVQQRQDELDAAQVGKRLTSTSVNEYGQIEVSFDWKTLEQQRVTGEVNDTEYKGVKDYYDKVVEDVGKINDTNSEIAQSINSLYEKRDEQYQMMSDYTQKLRDGMEDEEQKTIDKLNSLNDTLREAFGDLIDKVRKELDKQRKLEENAKTEKDISDKMNRLAMLRADTSGSNAAEIAQLQKDIEEATGSYEDNLEDQLLDRLEQQVDEAAKQREKQIKLLTTQLNYSKSAGIYLAKAEALTQAIANGTATGEQKRLAQLYYLSSDELLDKWGKRLSLQEFASETVKVSKFNEAVTAYDKAIQDQQKAAKKLYEAALKMDASFKSANQKQVEKDVKAHVKDRSAKAAYNKLVNEGGYEKSDALKILKGAGYTAKQFKTGGMSAGQAKAAGFTAKQAKGAGYTLKEVKDAGYSTKQALSAGYKRKDVVKQYGKKAVQQADAGTTKKTTIDTNGKKKGGKINTGTVNKSGTKVAAQKGKSVYTQAYDPKTGKGTGKTKKVAFKDFTAKFIKDNQKEAGKELLYQLRHNKVGSKIHKNWKSFIAASTYTGIKAGTNISSLNNPKGKDKDGTITKYGNIYYYTSNGVKYWNPTTGKTAFALKYNSKNKKTDKNAFLKAAQKNSGVSREYAQFLINKKLFTKKQLQNKGVKKFKSGGLANYTGPAWMDGTPSKPELVLNATDTKNFMVLKDILSEATKRGAFSRKEEDVSQGDMTFDININVDKIDSDYDVDKVAKRVEKIITTKAKTRNVTVVGRSR